MAKKDEQDGLQDEEARLQHKGSYINEQKAEMNRKGLKTSRPDRTKKNSRVCEESGKNHKRLHESRRDCGMSSRSVTDE